MEKIENLKKIIKQNLITYRKEAGLTQVQLAQKLGYSDKSVSKWEREEGVPDIYILKEIADLYGVTVNDLISDQSKKKSRIKEKISGLSAKNKIVISLLSAGVVWTIVTILNVIFDLVMPNNNIPLKNMYIYAIPVTCIILIIFNSIWGKKLFNLILISILIWTLTLSVYISFSIDNIAELFIIPIPIQILTVLSFMIDKKKNLNT